MGPLLRRANTFENKPRTGHTSIRLLCLDPDPLWAFASGTLTVVLTAQKTDYLVIGLRDPGRRHMTTDPTAAYPTSLPPYT